MGYRDSLLDLAGAVRSGMDPSIAYGIYGDMSAQHQAILAQQQAEQEARRARIQSLVDMVTQGAQTGVPMDTMEMVLAAQTGGGGLPPRVDNAMTSMYPPAFDLANTVSNSVAQVGAQAQAFGGIPAPTPQMPTMSPAYAPSPEQQMQALQMQGEMEQQQLAQQQAQMEAELTAAASDLAVDAVKYAAAGTPRDQFIQLAVQDPGYAALLAQDPERFQQIVLTAFAKETTPTQ